MFVLAQKDSYISVGPFNNMETLMQAVTKQYKYRISLYRKKRNWSWKLSQIFMETSNHIIKIEFLKWNWTDTMMIQTHLLIKSYFTYSRIEVIWRQKSFLMDGKSRIVEIRDNQTSLGKYMEWEYWKWYFYNCVKQYFKRKWVCYKNCWDGNKLCKN